MGVFMGVNESVKCSVGVIYPPPFYSPQRRVAVISVGSTFRLISVPPSAASLSSQF